MKASPLFYLYFPLLTDRYPTVGATATVKECLTIGECQFVNICYTSKRNI